MSETVSLRAPEVRTFPVLEFRDATESGSYLEGRAVPYNTWTDVGWYRERFAPGAFKKSIREAAAALPLLLWHDNRTFPIGKAEKWRESADGLDCVWKLDQTDERAREAAQKARDGFLTGLSVGFAPIVDDEIEIDDMGVVSITRREARLLEVSLTPTPAYAGAQVSLVRSQLHDGHGRRRSSELESWKNYLDKVRR